MEKLNFWKISAVSFLLLAAIFIIGIFSTPDNKLHVIACDVGQGDAILIVNKGNEILIDGGPDKSVVDCLSRHMPFWDRTIEMVILTHPQADHFTGLIDVFRRYKVGTFVANEVDNPDALSYRVLKKEVGSAGITPIAPYSGQRMRLGLIYLDILWPIEKEFKDLNDYSVVSRVTFGGFKAMFTGDLEVSMSDELIATNLLVPVDYIKIAHHGSRNGVTNKLFDILRPKVAVISAGKNNKFGHPHPETLNFLNERGIKYLGTYEIGDVEIISDGKSFWKK